MVTALQTPTMHVPTFKRRGQQRSEKRMACPPDTDGDGIRDDVDACPNEKGPPDSDSAERTVAPGPCGSRQGEIVILEQVQFKDGQCCDPAGQRRSAAPGWRVCWSSILKS